MNYQPNEYTIRAKMAKRGALFASDEVAYLLEEIERLQAAHASLVQEITAERDRYLALNRELVKRELPTTTLDREATIVRLTKELAASASLVQEMEPYLQHTQDCRIIIARMLMENAFGPMDRLPEQNCTCGLAALLRRSARPETEEK